MADITAKPEPARVPLYLGHEAPSTQCAGRRIACAYPRAEARSWIANVCNVPVEANPSADMAKMRAAGFNAGGAASCGGLVRNPSLARAASRPPGLIGHVGQ